MDEPDIAFIEQHARSLIAISDSLEKIENRNPAANPKIGFIAFELVGVVAELRDIALEETTTTQSHAS